MGRRRFSCFWGKFPGSKIFAPNFFSYFASEASFFVASSLKVSKKNLFAFFMPRRSRATATTMSTEPDMISMEHFPSKRGVMLNTKLYNAATLARHLKTGKVNVPHSRRKLTEAEYENIMRKAGRILSPTHSGDKRRYSKYLSRTSHKKMLTIRNGSLPLQRKYAAALLSKIRKRIDAELNELAKDLTDPGIMDPEFLFDTIYRLEKVNGAVKQQMGYSEILDALREYRIP